MAFHHTSHGWWQRTNGDDILTRNKIEISNKILLSSCLARAHCWHPNKGRCDFNYKISGLFIFCDELAQHVAAKKKVCCTNVMAILYNPRLDERIIKLSARAYLTQNMTTLAPVTQQVRVTDIFCWMWARQFPPSSRKLIKCAPKNYGLIQEYSASCLRGDNVASGWHSHCVCVNRISHNVCSLHPHQYHMRYKNS